MTAPLPSGRPQAGLRWTTCARSWRTCGSSGIWCASWAGLAAKGPFVKPLKRSVHAWSTANVDMSTVPNILLSYRGFVWQARLRSLFYSPKAHIIVCLSLMQSSVLNEEDCKLVCYKHLVVQHRVAAMPTTLPLLGGTMASL